AECHRLDHLIGSIAAGRYADILLVEDVEAFTIGQVIVSGEIVAEVDASEPGFGWSGDQLLYWKNDEIRVWTLGVKWTLAHVDPELAPQYPYDDAYFSADGTQFTITQYSYDGTSRRYVGV
ncbi:MAG TPA: hypothetical protein DCK98_08895, partial [Chloroflexi bacterium]|nr:hypothetical protein [Chloroflexota bacterium]